jgi:hypothetical protein
MSNLIPYQDVDAAVEKYSVYAIEESNVNAIKHAAKFSLCNFLLIS